MTKTNCTTQKPKTQSWKMGREEIIRRCIKKHGPEAFDYSHIAEDASGATCKIDVKCNTCNTMFKPSASAHYSRGSGCPKCARVKITEANTTKFEDFVAEAKDKHGDRYQYPKQTIAGKNYQVEILCPKHGVFYQNHKQHLRASVGCHECAIEENAQRAIQHAEKQRFTGEDFERESRKIYGDLLEYDHESFISTKKPVRIKCRTHGWFETSAHSHLYSKPSTPCPGCRKDEAEQQREQQREAKRKEAARQKRHRDFMRALTAESEAEKAERLAKNREARRKRSERNFIKRARKMHGDAYEYDPQILGFVKASGRVNIICKRHGVFNQKIRNHIERRRGCPYCGAERSAEMSVGWSRTDYIRYTEARNNGRALLYVIKCRDNNETFYKIGITARSVKERFNNDMPYKYEVIREIKGDAGFIYDAEKQFHKMNKKHKYEPVIKFGGHTECFSEITDDARFLLDVI